MKVELHLEPRAPAGIPAMSALADAQLVLFFLSPEYADAARYVTGLQQRYPQAQLVGCTTGGEIAYHEAHTGTAVSAAIRLERSVLRVSQTAVTGMHGSYEAGRVLASQLNDATLRLVFVLSDGLQVNGSELVRGLTEHLGAKVIVTGGLAGDGPRFAKTGVGVNGPPVSGSIAAVGFYGATLAVSYGSVGGWIKFGPERLITRAAGNVLYALDGKPALDLYKRYLGEEAAKLPGSGLHFPLSIRRTDDMPHDVVRTIIGIDEQARSLIFAGDVPEGYTAQLMRGNLENLVDGAADAALLALKHFSAARTASGTLGILVSCIGRTLVMGQRASDEVEAVKQALGDVSLAGFYSYGEICHHPYTGKCGLHNQTMTITLLSEAA